MAWFPDLSQWDNFASESAPVLQAVGWLARGHPYNTGEVSEQFFEKLCRLLNNPWEPFASAGMHFCDFCTFTGGNGSGQYKGHKISGASSHILFIPADHQIYVAPESIAHYIDAHQYLPPQEFIDAVLACPEMSSMDYKKALVRCGVGKLLPPSPVLK
jgi:hypothetical protein